MNKKFIVGILRTITGIRYYTKRTWTLLGDTTENKEQADKFDKVDSDKCISQLGYISFFYKIETKQTNE